VNAKILNNNADSSKRESTMYAQLKLILATGIAKCPNITAYIFHCERCDYLENKANRNKHHLVLGSA